jgi:hypothetical protein
MHSTVTNLIYCRLSNITIKKQTIMRTLNNNQITGTLTESKGNQWNSKRRYR